MAIIEKQTKTDYNVTFNEISHEGDFYACGLDESGVVRLITPDDKPIKGGTKVRSQLNGFGATSYSELMAELENINN